MLRASRKIVICLLLVAACLSWQRTALADDGERERLQQMLKEARARLDFVEQEIAELEAKIKVIEWEIGQMEAAYKKTQDPALKQALLDAYADLDLLNKMLNSAEAERKELMALIRSIERRLRRLDGQTSISQQMTVNG